MKYEWEEQDVICGRRLWTSSGASNGECLIGYRYEEVTSAKTLLLISLADGLVSFQAQTQRGFATLLNQYGYRPLDIRGVPR